MRGVLIAALVIAVMVLHAEAGHSGCHTRRVALRARMLALHKRAARCGDTDSACVDRIFKKISTVRNQLVTLRTSVCQSVSGSVRKCKRGSFKSFLRARRARINRMARKCSDEDDQCITNAMNLLIALNSDVSRQRRLWRRSCRSSKRSAKRRSSTTTTTTTTINAWVPRRVWTHEFTCPRIKAGFKKWLASQEARRKAFHDDSCKCKPNDLSCLRMNYQSIIHIQRRIRRARSLFADRMSRCDVCAPIKVRWFRWLRRQRARRHKYQLAACRCREDDTNCMQRNVDRIKRIQANIKTRRAQALALHGKCQTATTTTKAGTPSPF